MCIDREDVTPVSPPNSRYKNMSIHRLCPSVRPSVRLFVYLRR